MLPEARPAVWPQECGTRLVLRVRLTPKSSRDSLDGAAETPDGAALKARVRAVPENGAANKALLTLIAKRLKVPKSDISVSTGAKSRNKQLIILAKPAEIERIKEAVSELLKAPDKAS